MFIDNINHQNINTKINLVDNVDNKLMPKQENNKFMECFEKVLEEMSKAQNHAKTDAEKFTSNQSEISLNNVIINLEKSSIAMQIAIQVRNKFVSAYQEIMNQQI